MDKDEYNHLHGYQDAKDRLDAKILTRARIIAAETWADETAILDAITYSIAESEDYATMVAYCRKHHSMAMLGEITLELLDKYIYSEAELSAEGELT